MLNFSRAEYLGEGRSVLVSALTTAKSQTETSLWVSSLLETLSLWVTGPAVKL